MEGTVVQPDVCRDHPGVNDRLQEGLQAFDDCRWRDAIPCFQEVVARHPDQRDIAAKLAFALSQVGEYDQAVKILICLSTDEPRTARWPYMVGYQFYVRARWPEAIEWFDKALSLNPGYVKALYRKGYAHFRLGQTGECEKALKACIENWNRLSPELQQADRKTYGKANFLMGKTYLTRGLSLKARRPLQTAVETDGEDPDRRYELGKCLLQNGDTQGAIQELDRANTIRPGTDYVVDRLAQAYVRQGDLQRAEALYREIPRHRQRPFILKNLGKLYLEQGRADAALEVLQVAARKDRSNHNTQYLLGKALEAIGRHQAAIQAYQAAVALKHQNYGSDFPDAQDALQRLEDAMPESEEAPQPEAHLGPGEQMGVISHYNDSRGFGFIQSSGQKVFFHVTAVANGHRVVEGATVTFRVEQSERGPRAVAVRLLEESR